MKAICTPIMAIIATATISMAILFTMINSVNAFPPIPFDEIPLAVVNSDNGIFEFGADFSLDFGDATETIHDNNAEQANNMRLDRDDDTLSLEFECDANDQCGSNKAPQDVTISLVDRSVTDVQVVENSIPILVLESNECELNQTVEDCANFDFDIPDDTVTKRYKIVIKVDFDEAEWYFINSVRILG